MSLRDNFVPTGKRERLCLTVSISLAVTSMSSLIA